MAVPDFQKMMLPLLQLAADGKPHTLAEAVEHIATVFDVADEDRAQLLASGQTRIYNRVGWSSTYLRKAGVLQSVGPGLFEITERGREILRSNPTSIDVAYLEERFREMAEFRKAKSQDEADSEESAAVFDANQEKWLERDGVKERIQRILEAELASEQTRLAALRLMAFAIENADEERSDAWFVRETDHGVRLMSGRLLACALTRQKMRVSVMGPVSDDLREVLGADSEDDAEFRKIPGALLITFPAEHAEKALELLKEPINSFIDAAMSRVRSVVSLESHAPEAISFIAGVVGRELPQPQPGRPSADETPEDDEDPAESREPRVRGRAPIFEHGQRSIASLMGDIERGEIALPDLQRPFVWEDTKVRNLLDSLFVGFPVGTLVLWHTANETETRAIGLDRPGLRATKLVIDGQQRLTSLYAVMRGVEVVDKSGAPRRITIAFRPRDGRFEVADAAIRRDPEFLTDVTELWTNGRPNSQIRRELINGLRDKGRVVDDKYEDAVEQNLERARSISDYRFPTVDIRNTQNPGAADVTDEEVADIFVRINNQGTRLGQADFVLTLLSVFHGDLRDLIEERARAMSENSIVGVDAQQVLRAACAVAFGRARMAAVYRYVQGIDPTTGEKDPQARLQRLQDLDDAAKRCTESTPWRDFLLRVKHAGFVSPTLIASKNAIVNAYALYIKGKTADVQKNHLEQIVSRWIFGSLLTARYSTSSETVFEQDLALVARGLESGPAGLVTALDAALGETITGDYWTHTVVAALQTQKARAPTALAFRAAQIVLGAHALFSDQLLQNLLDAPGQAGRSASEGHHLFPAAWFNANGIHDRRVINQVANLADVGWYENSVIGGRRGPADYVPRLRERLHIEDDQWGKQCAEHALPIGWEKMEYEEFAEERRTRMADLIRVAYRKLGGESDAPPLTPPWFLPGAEEVWRQIADVEKNLRSVVKRVYAARYGDQAAQRLEAMLQPQERDVLARALRSRPTGADPLSVIDYLYLGQLPTLLFAQDVWQEAARQFAPVQDLKHRLKSTLDQVIPVRNEIAHIREVPAERLMRASVACSDLSKSLLAN